MQTLSIRHIFNSCFANDLLYNLAKTKFLKSISQNSLLVDMLRDELYVAKLEGVLTISI